MSDDAVAILKIYTGLSFPKLMKVALGMCLEACKMICVISSRLDKHRIRTKYNDIEKANRAYRKQRKHIHKQARKMIMILFVLPDKLFGEVRRQIRGHPDKE